MQKLVVFLFGLVSGSCILLVLVTVSMTYFPDTLDLSLDVVPTHGVLDAGQPTLDPSSRDLISGNLSRIEDDIIDKISLLYRTDIEAESRMSLVGGPMDYLPDYKNPCWISNLTSANPYEGSKYGDLVEFYPGVGRFSVPESFRHMTSVFTKRLANGDPWRIRCLPLLYLAGITKSGTTDLFQKIISHPDVVQASVKEPMWWNRQTIGRQRHMTVIPYPFSSYVDLFDEAGELIRRNHVNVSDSAYHSKITLDATPAYLWDYDGWQMIPGNMGLQEPKYTLAHSLKALVPSAKVVAILRNPVDRLYSQYRMRAPGTTPKQFHDEVLNALDVMNDCMMTRTVRSCAYDSSVYKKEFKEHDGGIFLRASMYFPFMDDWLSVFGPDQLLTVRAEDYYENRTTVMERIFQFLDLRTLSHVKLEELENTAAANSKDQHESRSKEPMLNSTRVELNNFFRPLNQQLAELMQDNGYLWDNA